MNFKIVHPLDYEDHPRGHEPDHFQHLEDTLIKRGHTKGVPLDFIVFNSGVWNLGSGGTSPYDINLLQQVIDAHIPVVWMDNFDHAGTDKHQGRWPGSDDWKDMLNYDCTHHHYHHWAWFGYYASRRNKLIYFMRKMQIHQDYPPYVFPLEYPIFEDHTLASWEAYHTRPFDVCGLANISLPRAQSMTSLYKRGEGLQLDLEIIPDYRRLDHYEWMRRHANAKFFLEADASLGSERPMKLMTVAAMLRIKSDHKLPFPRTDMEHMVEIGDYDGYVSKSDVDKLKSVIHDPDLNYRIYVQGAEHMREHYSLEDRSNYIVDVIERELCK